MLYMYIERDSAWIIRVSEKRDRRWRDYPERRYIDYTKREAVKMYRQEFGLVGRHMQTNDWTKESKPGLIESLIALQELNKELERGI